MTTTRLLTLLSILTFPALASAQTLMVEQAPIAPQPVLVQPAPVVQQPLVVQEPAPESDFDAAVGLGMWVEMMSLDALTLRLGSPEITALTGVELNEDWQGQQALRAPLITGAMLSVGMRVDDWIRGPELRFMLGGSDIEGESVLAPGSSGLSLTIEQAVIFCTELALGVQAPLGPFHPYVMGRVSVGGAFVDVRATDDRLGSIGTETAEQLLVEAGVEVGASIDIGDGFELGAAFRAAVNQDGDESLGGMVTITIVEGD
jgi:hypothetical protein